METPKVETRRSTAEKICWGVAAAGATVTVLPFLGGESLGMGRYAFVLIGALVGGTALLVIPLFRARRRVANALGDDTQLLARWEVPAEEWAAWVGEDAVRERQAKWHLFRIVFGFSVVIGGFFVWMDPQGGPWVLGVLLGVCAICAVAVVWGTRLQKGRRQRGPRTVRICADGLRLGEELHVWEGFGARLEAVEVGGGQPPVLEIVYSTRAKNQRQINSVRVPISRGAEAAAADVAVRLGERLRGRD